jgi:hypothetical protein
LYWATASKSATRRHRSQCGAGTRAVAACQLHARQRRLHREVTGLTGTAVLGHFKRLVQRTRLDIDFYQRDMPIHVFLVLFAERLEASLGLFQRPCFMSSSALSYSAEE